MLALAPTFVFQFTNDLSNTLNPAVTAPDATLHWSPEHTFRLANTNLNCDHNAVSVSPSFDLENISWVLRNHFDSNTSSDSDRARVDAFCQYRSAYWISQSAAELTPWKHLKV